MPDGSQLHVLAVIWSADLIQDRCPHRGAPLSYGRLEANSTLNEARSMNSRLGGLLESMEATMDSLLAEEEERRRHGKGTKERQQ